MTAPRADQEYALAIQASGRNHVAPVVYDLSSEAIDIGSADDNAIVLQGADIEPYHLAVRRVGSRVCGMVDLTAAQRLEESFWLGERDEDRVYCPDHGRLRSLQEAARCPLCHEQNQPLWLLRPLRPGDVFPIGHSFKATVLSQGSPNQPVSGRSALAVSPWPDTRWLENPPEQPTILMADDASTIEPRDYPINDSNLWAWDPPESPFPVFMHHRANRFVTQHAFGGTNREVGGLLLGRVYREPRSATPYPVISHAIAARYATEARGHLTFTNQTWLDLIRQREEHHPDTLVVGWYHTHPGLQIFLSEWDLLIHRHFFRQPWQVALVIDPHQNAAGFFVWAGGDVLDPQQPYGAFRVFETSDEARIERPARVRIKLGEYSA